MSRAGLARLGLASTLLVCLSPFIGVAVAQDALRQSYVQLAQQFAAGDRIGATQALIVWDQKREKSAIDALIDWFGHREQPGHGTLRSQDPTRKIVEAAVMLETDLALSAVHADASAAEQSHFKNAHTLMDALRNDEAAAFERHWYLAVGTTFITWGKLGRAESVIRLGLEEFGSDPYLHLASGIRLETQAAFTDPNQPLAAKQPSRGGLLHDAEREFRKALEADADLGEARMRLGRVLFVERKRDEAKVELARAAAAREPRVSYLAHLFLGRLLVDAGDLTGARREYEAAQSIDPRWPTPYIAIGELDVKLGRVDEARQAMGPLVSGPSAAAAGASDDPWWMYRFGGGGQLLPAVQWLATEIHP